MAGHSQVQLALQEQLLSRNGERFRGGLVFKARRPLYYSALGSRAFPGAVQGLLEDKVQHSVGVYSMPMHLTVRIRNVATGNKECLMPVHSQATFRGGAATFAAGWPD